MASPTPEEVAAGVPAGANIVQRIPGPNGQGTIAVDDQGGVYTFGGAQFYGSYWSPEMEQHRNDPNRRFTGIQLEGGGYRLISNNPNESGYFFGPQAQTPSGGSPAPGEPAPADPALEGEKKSARADIEKLASDYGLDPGFVERMWGQWLNTKDMNAVYAEMIKDPAYKARFPGMDALRKQGRAISEAEYIAQETQIVGLMKYYSLPAGFYDDPKDFGELIGGGVSPKEIEDRIVMAGAAASQVDPTIRNQLTSMYGLSEGDLVAFFLDPDKEMQIATKRFTAAQIGGAAVSTGFGQLTKTEAETLGVGGRNLTAEQARAGFEQVRLMDPLFAETVTETEDLGRSEQLGVVGGDVDTMKKVERRRQSRQAAFEGGGGAATFGQGRSGLG